MSNICDDLRTAILQALIPDPDKCPEEKQDYLVKLSDLPLTYMRGNGLRKNDVVEKGTRKCVLYGELFTRHTEGIINEADLSETNTISNVLSKSGDILIPGTSTASKEVMLRARELYVDDVQIGGDINILRPNAELFYPKYMSYVFDTFSSKRQLFEYITGTTGIIHISNSGIKNLVFYLPPIDEQKRIVEKVDELMARVADLEQSADALASLKKAFPDDIKASLLQAAMQGKLTKQLPEDGNAEELLDQIKAEKERLIAEGKIKKQKPLAPIADDETPFSVPENWEWVRLESIISFIGDKSNQIKESDVKEEGTFPVVSQSKEKIIGYCDDENKVVFVDEPVLVFGDHTALIKYIDFDFIVGADGVKIMKPIIINPFYLYYALTYNLIGISSIGGYSRHYKFIKDKLIPIPPQKEQERIVDKLSNSMQDINAVGELIASE